MNKPFLLIARRNNVNLFLFGCVTADMGYLLVKLLGSCVRYFILITKLISNLVNNDLQEYLNHYDQLMH